MVAYRSTYLWIKRILFNVNLDLKIMNRFLSTQLTHHHQPWRPIQSGCKRRPPTASPSSSCKSGSWRRKYKPTSSQQPTNLYASTKFPCTRSPNSRFSASSWKKSGLRGTTFWLINLFICCKTYHVLVNCTIDWHAWNSCTITWRLDIFWTNSNNRKSELFLPKRKTNTAPGIDGFPQVDLTTALAAWKLSLTKRFPSWLNLYRHRLALFGMALDTMVTNWVAF